MNWFELVLIGWVGLGWVGLNWLGWLGWVGLGLVWLVGCSLMFLEFRGEGDGLGMVQFLVVPEWFFFGAADLFGRCEAGLWLISRGLSNHFCDILWESPPCGGLVFGVRPFLLYHRSGFHFPQPWCEVKRKGRPARLGTLTLGTFCRVEVRKASLPDGTLRGIDVCAPAAICWAAWGQGYFSCFWTV